MGTMRKKVALVFFLSVFLIGGYALSAGAENVFVMSHTQEFGTVDPARGTDYTEAYAMLNLYDPLVFPGPDGEIITKLAYDWEISDDGLTYTFYIRDYVQFHDGSKLTAEDVKFSMDRMLALGDGYSWLWMDFIDEVVIEDTYVVSFHLKEPFAPFLATLPWFFVVNKELVLENAREGDYGEYGDYGTGWLSETTNEDAGSGPYTLRSWDRGREIVFNRFPDYWEGWPQGDKHLDRVHSIYLPETATVKTMLRRDELQLVEHWRTFPDYEDMEGYEGVEVLSFHSTEQLSFKINTQRGPTDCLHFRRALAWAFDYETVNNDMEPGSLTARGPIPETIPGHNSNVFQFEFDLDKARAELEQSKYYPDFPTIYLVTPSGLENRRWMSVRLKETLEQIGINLEIHVEPWGRMTDLASTKETTPNIMVISVAANYPDPDSFLYAMYHSRAAGTWMSTEWLQNPEVDRLINQSRATIEEDEREEILFSLQEKIVDLCPDIFVHVMPLRVAVKDYVRGFTVRPVMSFYYYFHDWWYDK